MTSINTYIDILKQGRSLREKESYTCLNRILSGKVPEPQIYQLLKVLSEKGETVAEMVGFARAMKKHMVVVALDDKKALDVCGTGGSGRDRFNVSTAVAFVLGSLGVTVAKHGNVGSRKPNGSFDFLHELGIQYGQTPKELVELSKKKHLCFLFAKSHHPAMKYVSTARKELGRRTIFNVLGPLCNPAKVAYQIVGTTTHTLAKNCAEATQKLGTKRSLFIVAGDGIDEMSHQATNTLYDVTKKKVSAWTFDPKGTEWYSKQAVFAGKTADENAAFFLSFIQGKTAHDATLSAICLNAGLGLLCVGKVDSIEEGAALAKQQLVSGDVYRYFEEFKGYPL